MLGDASEPRTLLEKATDILNLRGYNFDHLIFGKLGSFAVVTHQMTTIIDANILINVFKKEAARLILQEFDELVITSASIKDIQCEM